MSFYYGADILVHPITTKQSTKTKLFLPPDQLWYLTDSTKPIKPRDDGLFELEDVKLSTIPVFARGGSIIPMRMEVQGSTQEMENVPLTFVAYPDLKGNALLLYYTDDGKSFGYKSEEGYAIWKVELVNGCSISITKVEGQYKGAKSGLDLKDIVIVGKSEHETVKVNGEKGDVKVVPGAVTKILLERTVDPFEGMKIELTA